MKGNAMRMWIGAAVVMTMAQAAPAPPAQSSLPDRRARLETAFADIDRAFVEFTKTAHVPGAAWGIVIDGELAHTGVDRLARRRRRRRRSTPTRCSASRR